MLQNVDVMISTIRPAENDSLMASDSILQISHLSVAMGLSENLAVNTPKCRCGYKDHEPS